MNQASVEQYAAALRERYSQAGKKEKGQMLDQVVAASGYHRKSATRLLAPKEVRREVRRRGSPVVYDEAVAQAARLFWEASGYLGSRRLKPAIVAMLNHPSLVEDLAWLAGRTRSQLMQVSAATLDRLLKPARRRWRRRRLRQGPSSAHLRRTVALKTFADWDESQPGCLQVDLVAHCGGSGEGSFLYTLTAVDVATGWVELEAVPSKGQQAVLGAIDRLSRRLPMPLLALSCDNGSEFMNHRFLRYCRERGITLTRGRPRKKNDNAWVEQKNGALVRELVGHTRFSSLRAYEQLQALYAMVRLHSNYFQPNRKLVAKTWSRGRQRRVYDDGRTPYQRLSTSGALEEGVRQNLESFYKELNPFHLKRQVDTEVQTLWTCRARRTTGSDEQRESLTSRGTG